MQDSTLSPPVSLFERRFLARSLPAYIRRLPHLGISATYFDNDESRTFCLRSRGDTLEMVRTIPSTPPGHMQVRTLPLTLALYEVLCLHTGPTLHKLSYYPPQFPWCFDCFLGALKGLVLVRIAFSSEVEMRSFELPDFVLQEVTQDHIFSDGNLAGTSYAVLEDQLRQYGYRPLLMLD